MRGFYTSYWFYFGGGYRRNGTFIEYSKNLIDQLNAFHSEQKQDEMIYLLGRFNSLL